MNDVDSAVRAMLTVRAGDVRDAPGLLDGVHRKVRRKRNRRLALASVIGVLALAAGSALAWSVERDDRLVPTERTSAGPTAGSSTVPPSPVSLGRLPAGYSAPPVVLDTKDSWVFPMRRAQHPYTSLEVRVSRVPLQPLSGPGQRRTVRIGDTTATLYTVPPHEDMAPPYDVPMNYGGPYSELTYQRAPGVWIRIVAGHDAHTLPLGLTEADLLRVATGLSDRPTPVPDVFRFATVPDGVVVGGAWSGFRGDQPRILFVPPTAPAVSMLPKANSASTNLEVTPLVVEVRRADDILQPLPRLYDRKRTLRLEGRTITVYREHRGDRSLYVTAFGDGRSLGVNVADELDLSDEEAARFVVGITPGPDFRCCR